jgi:lysophospholipase L1-like esterase
MEPHEASQSRQLRRVLLAVGLGFVGVALTADWIGLSNPQGIGRGQIFLAALGGGLALVGWLGARVRNLYTQCALLLLNTILLLVVLEFAAHTMLFIDRYQPAAAGVREEQPGPDANPNYLSKAASAPYYREQSWTSTYWEEFDESSSMRYAPYVVWQRKPYRGRTIQIDESSVRNTPGADCRAGAYRVFVFGGSVVWGTGAPDWETIPAALQARLAASRPGPICVVNLGESAYVSSQEVILLVNRLRSGAPPDLVLFLDGVNEIFAAYQSGRADAHYDLARVSARFDGAPPSANRLPEWLWSSSLFRLSNSLVSMVASPPSTLVTYRSLGVDAKALADAVAAEYVRNTRIVQTLAENYHFDAHFFWQPVITEGDKPLTDSEREIVADMDPALVDLLDGSYARVRALSGNVEDFHDLSGVFDDQSSQIWLDFVHMTPVGNQLIGDEILRAIAMDASGSH